MRKTPAPSTIKITEERRACYFSGVRALPDYRLEVAMDTGATIYFNFRTRFGTVRFGSLRDEERFLNVHTDGNYLIFDKAGTIPVKITASEFIDLVLIHPSR